VLRNTVDLSSIAVLLAALVGGAILGVVGALMAIPVVAAVKVLMTPVVEALNEPPADRDPPAPPPVPIPPTRDPEPRETAPRDTASQETAPRATAPRDAAPRDAPPRDSEPEATSKLEA